MKKHLPLLAIFVLLTSRIYFFYLKPLPFKEGDRIRITAYIKSEPLRFDTAQYLRIEGVKMYLPLYPEISYGDRVVVEGEVSEGKLQNPKLIEIKESRNLLYSFREQLIKFYKSSLPEPHASLVAGVAIGSKKNVPQGFWDTLKNSGTAHVVVASGMNVTLVGGFLVNAFALILKRKWALIFALIGIWVYAVLCGFDAPIVRAAIMGSIAFSAQELGRLNISLRALMLSAFLMLFIKPSYVEDLGFWLSFLATLSLITFESKIRSKLNIVPEVLKQDLSTTLAAQIGVAPLLLYFFGQLNFLSPIANVLVLWTIVPITLLGIIGGLTGLLVPIAGKLILYLSYPLTTWFISVVNLF